MIRKTLLPVLMLVAFFIAGCSGSVDSDLKATPEEVRKTVEGLSAEDLQKRLDELEKRSEVLKKEVSNKEPSEAQMQQMTKYIEVGGIYATELMKKKMK